MFDDNDFLLEGTQDVEDRFDPNDNAYFKGVGGTISQDLATDNDPHPTQEYFEDNEAKADSVFAAFGSEWNFRKAYNDVTTRRFMLENVYNNLELEMVRRGIRRNGLAFTYPLTHPRRVEERDRLISQYNLDNDDAKLPTTEDALGTVNYYLVGDTTRDGNLSDPRLKYRAARWAADFAYGVRSDFVQHPILATSVMLGVPFAGYAAVAGAIASEAAVATFVANRAVDGVAAALLSQLGYSERKEIAQLTNQEISSRLGSVPRDFTEGFITSAALSLLFKGVGKTYKSLGLPHLPTPAFRRALSTSPEARAVLYDNLKRHSPNSIFTPAAAKRFADIKNAWGISILDGASEVTRQISSVAVNTIKPLQRLSFLPKNRTTFAARLAEEVLQAPIADELAAYRSARVKINEGLSTDATLRQTAITSTLSGSGFRVNGEVPRTTWQTARGIIEESIKTVRQYREQLAGFDELIRTTRTVEREPAGALRGSGSTGGDAGGGGAGGGAEFGPVRPDIRPYEGAIETLKEIRSALTDSLFDDYPLTREFLKDLPNTRRALEEAVQTLYINGKPSTITPEILINQSVTRSSLAKVNRIRREAIFTILSEINRANITEGILATVQGSEARFTGSVKLNRIYHNVRNVMNSALSETNVLLTDSTSTLNRDIIKTITKGKKLSNASLNDLDVVAFADAMLSKDISGVAGTEAAVAGMVKDWNERWYQELMQRGFDVGKHENYMPNMWDPKKISGYGKKEFVETMINLADVKRMQDVARQNNRPINNVKGFFGSVYDNITTDLSATVTTDTLGNTTSTRSRIIFFKEGQDWFDAHTKFGKSTNVFDVFENVTGSMKRDVRRATIGIYDPTGVVNMNSRIFNGIRKAAKSKQSTDAFNVTAQALKLGEVEFRNILTEFAGYGLQPDKSSVLLTALGSTLNIARLSKAFVTNLFTDAFGSMSIMKRSIGIENTVLKEMFGVLNRASRQELQEVLAVSTYLNESALSDLNLKLPFRVAKKGALMPLELSNQIGSFNDIRARLVFTHHLAKQQPFTFEALPQKTRAFMLKNGIKAADWEVYRKLPSHDIGGATVLSAHKLRNSKQLLNKRIFQLFANMERQATLTGAPRTTPFGSSGSLSAGASPYAAFRKQVIDPYTNIVQSIYLTQFNAMLDILRWQNKGDISMLMGGVMTGGYITYIAKSFLQGRKPDIASPQAAVSALIYSGFFGQGVDDLLSSVVWGDYSSPIEDITNAVKKPNFKNLRGAASLVNPYRGTLVGDMVAKYTTDQLFGIIDPEGARAYDAMLMRQVDEGRIFEARQKLLSRS